MSASLKIVTDEVVKMAELIIGSIPKQLYDPLEVVHDICSFLRVCVNDIIKKRPPVLQH